MTTSVPDAPLSDIPGVPDADDIPEVIAPPGAYAPLPPGEVAELKEALGCLGRVMDSALGRLPAMLDAQSQALAQALTLQRETLSASDAGALQHLCEALEGLKSGLLVTGSPYRLTMQALTPQGFPVALTIERQDGAAFFEALVSMATWLQTNGYTMPPAAVAF